MTTARKQLISLEDTPYYHCISRCVRRAFLCGEDKTSGQNFDHRRGWVEDKLLALSQVFAIEVCAYAVMSNHTHLVLYVDVETAKGWSTHEVIARWHQLYQGTLLTQQYRRGETIPDYAMASLMATVDVYRQRLMDISWFMRILNQSIATQANREDNCTGRFWEGRFKSQALLDDAALAACMAYVDLNPVRANMAKTPESSDFTSVKQRVMAAKTASQPNGLLPFVGNPRKDMPKGLTFALQDYLELIELTGRCMRADKAGHIEANQPPLLSRLNITPDNWLTLTQHFTRLFHGAVGHRQVLTSYCAHQGLKRRTNVSYCDKLLA